MLIVGEDLPASLWQAGAYPRIIHHVLQKLLHEGSRLSWLCFSSNKHENPTQMAGSVFEPDMISLMGQEAYCD